MPNKSEGSAKHQGVSIRKALPTHSRGMAMCHIGAFHGRFMCEMGPVWLGGLYRFFIRHNSGISLVAVNEDNNIVGFAVGGQPGIREQFLRKALFRYAHILFAKFLTKSLVREVLLGELAVKLHLKKPEPVPSEPKTFDLGQRCGDLLSICVLPKYEGAGIAGRLVMSFRDACSENGYETIALHVVSDNTRAVAFYKKHGWFEIAHSGESLVLALRL